MRASVLFLLVPASLASYGGFLYYRLAWLHHQSRQALRHVDDQISQHHELIPHLLLALANHAHHERGIIENVIHARKLTMSAVSLEERILASIHLSQALHHLFRFAETCSLLHTDDETALLHMQVVLAEQKIALAREYYNHIAEHFNDRISRFPSNVMARLVGLERKLPFEMPENFSHNYAPMQC